MGHLKHLVQYTAELCHELQELDRREQAFRREHIQENPNLSPADPPLAILRAELKSQKKHVRSLKKKSLWSKILEEAMAKLEISDWGVENVYTKNFYKTVGSKTYIPKNLYMKTTYSSLTSEKFGRTAAPTKLRP
ncbi:hypothetical protein Hdeb2414_s0003g00084751 [Helianthus debilis subsp. tardiflorus]